MIRERKKLRNLNKKRDFNGDVVFTDNIDDILNICKKSLKENIAYVEQILLSNLNNKQKNIYGKFASINFNYDEFNKRLCSK